MSEDAIYPLEIDECEKGHYYEDDCEQCGDVVEVRVGSLMDRGEIPVLCDDCAWGDGDDD
jgi:hypothetical protein